MTHLTDLQCSLYVDEALSADEARVVISHLDSCSRCQTRAAGFVNEKGVIASSLRIEDRVVVPALVPKFSKTISLRDFAVANVLMGIIFWSSQFLWKTLFGELIVNALTEIALIYIPDIYELTVSTALYFLKEGTAMIDTYLGYIVVSLIVLAAMWIAFSYRKSRTGISVFLLLAVTGGVVTPPSANALEVRHTDEIGMVSVTEAETINDTLVIVGETVVIDGSINGDLLAFGERVVINGTVHGNLITGAESISIRGEVDGFVVTAGSSVELNGAIVGGDLWAAGESVRVDSDSRVARNVSIFGETLSVEGDVGRDLSVFGEILELSGSVGEDVEAFTQRINLFGDARVEGDLRFRTSDETNLQQSATAKIGGEVQFLSESELFESNEYATGAFYKWELIRLVSAFMAGFALLWLIPELRHLKLSGGVDGIKTTGIGLVSLVSLPIIALLLAITVIGIPLTIIGLFFYVFVIYFAKIVVASMLGQMLLASTTKQESLPLTLLAGLLVVLVVVNIPGIGGVINFILTMVGIGMLVQRVLDYSSRLGEKEVA